MTKKWIKILSKQDLRKTSLEFSKIYVEGQDCFQALQLVNLNKISGKKNETEKKIQLEQKQLIEQIQIQILGKLISNSKNYKQEQHLKFSIKTNGMFCKENIKQVIFQKSKGIIFKKITSSTRRFWKKVKQWKLSGIRQYLQKLENYRDNYYHILKVNKNYYLGNMIKHMVQTIQPRYLFLLQKFFQEYERKIMLSEGKNDKEKVHSQSMKANFRFPHHEYYHKSYQLLDSRLQENIH